MIPFMCQHIALLIILLILHESQSQRETYFHHLTNWTGKCMECVSLQVMDKPRNEKKHCVWQPEPSSRQEMFMKH